MILGSGGFGCALSIMCEKMGHKTVLYSPFEEELSDIRRDGEHKRLLPGAKIPPTVELTSDLSRAGECELAIIATPSFAVRSTAGKLGGHLREGAVVACVSKGLEDGTLKTFSQVMDEELPKNHNVIISGPSHAEEIARFMPTTVVAASKVRAAAEFVQDTLMNPSLRIYVNDDVTGVQLGGALKNIIALAAGASDGLGLGDNPKAALMTRGITEIARLGVAMGAKTETFAGLSGIGDLIVTCTSMHSRNRRAGILIGQGKSAGQAIEEIGMTVEGYKCAKTAYDLAQRTGVEMPIITEVYKVLYEGKSPKDAIRALMDRPKRHESEVIWLLSK
ncbi:MAG: NAD(P)-dependent glycerol-3-phosphate dehydrogenase [Clostridiales bacterium]|nr:MAG: NAD(P)-dependent glycerol-3-phosphate dehydrogenase [Clostridiales bacterium]RGB63822.1 NAD(P)-dependent glycerol-3-phosphate dehydrogenase [Harryflintia acetispora]